VAFAVGGEAGAPLVTENLTVNHYRAVIDKPRGRRSSPRRNARPAGGMTARPPDP
jgi:hypothetical protein